MAQGTRTVECGTRNVEHAIRIVERGTERGSWNAERKADGGTRNGMWDAEHGTRNVERGTWSLRYSATSQKRYTIVKITCDYKRFAETKTTQNSVHYNVL